MISIFKEIIEARDYVFFVLVFVEFLLALSFVVNFIIDPVRKKRNQDYKFNKLGIIFTSFFCIFVLIQFIPMLIVIFIYFFGSTWGIAKYIIFLRCFWSSYKKWLYNYSVFQGLRYRRKWWTTRLWGWFSYCYFLLGFCFYP